jgi:phosphoribosylglycinamide formyltransferase 1
LEEEIIMDKPKLLVFASGSKTAGGSGFENLVVQSRENPEVNFEVVAVVSNHENGGVRGRAAKLGVKFIHFAGPFERDEYQRLVRETGAEWVALSGWLKLALGLDPAKTINIHPGPLPRFGGKGMYGHYVHDAVVEAYKNGEVTHGAVTMHFVTEVYDEGPVFFRFPVKVEEDDTGETLGARVLEEEHKWQPLITSQIVNSEISWDGENRDSLKVPEGYKYL